MADLYDYSRGKFDISRDDEAFRRALRLMRKRERWAKKLPRDFTYNHNGRYVLGTIDAKWWGSVTIPGLGSLVIGDFESATDLLLDAATLAGDEQLLKDLLEGGRHV